MTVVRENSNKANGLTFDHQGRLLTAEGGGRVTRTEKNGAITVLAEKDLQAPNDLVYCIDGSIYFTDPAIRMAFADRDLPTAVYRIAPDGTLSQFIEAEFPNGLALSLDERTLYINNTRGIPYIQHAEIRPDGTPGRRGILVDMWGEEPGVPDGMKCDIEGNVYCTGPNGVHVIDPKGRLLGRLKVPGHSTNMAWGDDDWCSLFVTTYNSVYRTRVKVPGVAVW